MDEMKIGSKMMKNVVAKLMTRGIKNKSGYDIRISLNDLNATVIDGTAHVHLNIDAELSKDELERLIKAIGL